MPPRSRVRGQKRVTKFLEQDVPKIVNAEFNRGMAATMGAFSREFTKARLSGGGITVRRRVRAKKKGRGQPFVPAKARAVGFTARLSPTERLQGKTATFRTSNPILIAHEEGAIIRPRRGRFLTIQVKKKRQKKDRRFKRGTVVARVRRVVLRARLGFDASWRQFIPQALDRMRKTRDRATDRANRRGAKL